MTAAILDGISAGRVIDGRFPLVQELGGTEWTSAWRTELDDGRLQRAAIKIFPFEYVDAHTTLARWDVARTLSHPHLMPLFDAGRCELDGDDLLFVVTEYADETLSQLLPERPLSPREARQMLGPILDALSYLHQLSLTHGHLRPTNIMVVDDQLKLSPDFGWCSRARNIYDPPEAAANGTPEADIWSLGILLVESLTQQPPVWNRWQCREPEIPATIPEPFFTICRECLRIDPAQRCTLDAIQALLNLPQPERFAVQPAEAIPTQATAAEAVVPIADRDTGPPLKLRAIFTGATLVLLFLAGAFLFGWQLTPAPLTFTPQPPATQPTAAPAPSAPTAPPAAAAPHAAATRKPAFIKGVVAHQAMPRIPEEALHTIEGRIRVEIRVVVDPRGNVARAVIAVPGPSRYFANEALSAAQNWKFTPAQVNGRAAPSTWLLHFQFGHSRVEATQSEQSP